MSVLVVFLRNNVIPGIFSVTTYTLYFFNL